MAPSSDTHYVRITKIVRFLVTCDTTVEELVGTYLCPSVWSSYLGFVESCPWILIPSVATALFRIEPIASTDSFSRTSTLHLLSRAAFTWKDGFSVVAPIKVTVPHSTCGRKVSYRRKHIQIQVRLILLGIQ